jgi:hypothetical protein
MPASKDLYLRSLADKNETGYPNNLRLRSDADKIPVLSAKSGGMAAKLVAEKLI